MLRAAVLFFSLAALLPADVTGRWTGTAEPPAGNGEQKQFPLIVTLTQRGADVIGSAFVDDKDWPIESGKVQGDRLTFQVNVKSDVVRFELDLAGDRLTGKASVAGKQDEVRINLARKAGKPPALDLTGRWSGAITRAGEPDVQVTIEFRQTGNGVDGRVMIRGDSWTLSEGGIDGSKITFRIVRQGEQARFALVATADQLIGFTAVKKGDSEMLGDVELNRDTKTPRGR